MFTTGFNESDSSGIDARYNGRMDENYGESQKMQQ
jgi:hypothetical protein